MTNVCWRCMLHLHYTFKIRLMPPWILEQVRIIKMAAGEWLYCTNQDNVTVVLNKHAVVKPAFIICVKLID